MTCVEWDVKPYYMLYHHMYNAPMFIPTNSPVPYFILIILFIIYLLSSRVVMHTHCAADAATEADIILCLPCFDYLVLFLPQSDNFSSFLGLKFKHL